MKILKTKQEIKLLVNELKNSGKTIGFVPTMGALHKGHISLVEQAKENTDFVVVSIFVNPTQFNDKKDLEKYPRQTENDIEKLNAAKADALFLPDEKEMYPEKDNRQFDFGNLDKVMEGRFRPGHFNGVAQIVSKLFETVNPDKAFFGLKDFQQYVIIKQLVKKFMPNYNIEIIACPIVREANGLAMSSRNELLTKEQRENASFIAETLTKYQNYTSKYNIEDFKNKLIEEINSNPFLEVEYFDIVDDTELQQIKSWDEENKKVGCIAVFCGKVRLIDNIYYSTTL